MSYSEFEYSSESYSGGSTLTEEPIVPSQNCPVVVTVSPPETLAVTPSAPCVMAMQTSGVELLSLTLSGGQILTLVASEC